MPSRGAVHNQIAMTGKWALLALASCHKPAPAETPRIVARTRPVMGTIATMTAWTADEPGAVAAFDAAFTEVERLERLMTVWRKDSDISRLNDAAGKGPVKMAPEVIDALLRARQVSEWTGGQFDVTFGALSGLWKFDQDQDNRVPDPAEVAKRLPLIDYRDLAIDAKAGTAELRRAGMRAHLGGIGKGYAVDAAVRILRARGFRDFMIQAGGDLYVAGMRGGRAWRVGIRDPRGPPERFFAATEITDATFSTSGDYERSFVKGGVRYHHILNPRTGQPARLCRSVTIKAPDATLADGLSTGVFLLGPEEGMALVGRLPGVDAVIVDAHNHVVVSPGLKGRLKILMQPTDGI
jgi:FAD:protein FMN transferase